MPEEGYFEEEFNSIKDMLAQRLSYQSYIDILEQTKDVIADEQISIPMEGLQVGSLNINLPKFVDFELIEQCKPYYFPWIRGICFILLLLGQINGLYKMIRGTSLMDIAFHQGTYETNTNNGQLRIGDGKK